jgi:hypothetical protein
MEHPHTESRYDPLPGALLSALDAALGPIEPSDYICQPCRGSGLQTRLVPTEPRVYDTFTEPCPMCAGTGRVEAEQLEMALHGVESSPLDDGDYYAHEARERMEDDL